MLKKITVYSSAHCPYCDRAKDLLAQYDADFEEVRVDLDDVKRDEMMAKSKRRTVPQIFFDDDHIGGYDDLYALHQSNQLSQRLAQLKES